MREKLAERVYETLSGLLEDAYCVPGVQNAFAEGASCAVLYERVMQSYERLCERLAVGEEDMDVEIIIDSFLEMNKILCLKMFDYGVQFSDVLR